MVTSEAQKRAIKAHTAKLRSEGYRKVAFWLSPAQLAIIDRIAARIGSRSRQGALEHVLEEADHGEDHAKGRARLP